MRPTRAVIYRGPSMLTGDPIVAVIIGMQQRSSNRKTGDMLQTYILRSDIAPNEAVASGADAAICGKCPLRGSLDARTRHMELTHQAPSMKFGRGCYVPYWRGPLQVFKALADTPTMAPAEVAPLLAGEHVRLSAYGDPAAVPFDVWDRAFAEVAGWTAYTHQWRTCDQRLRDLLMASVESEAAAADAKALGWRTFRVRKTVAHRVLDNEVVCPASDEAGHRAQCEDCQLCRGQSNAAKSIVIVAHGRWATQVHA